MYQQILTPRATPVVTPEQLAAFGRFDVPDQYDMSSPPNVTDDYALLEEMIEAATDAVETLAAVACISEEILLTFDFFPGQQDPRQLYNYQIGYAYDWTPWWWYGFPSADSIELVRRPVLDGTAGSPPTHPAPVVNYMDVDGNMQVMDPTTYDVFANKITLLPGAFWPRAAARRQDVVRVDYWTGYSETPDGVPAKLKQAIKFLANWWHENRLAVGTEPTFEVMNTLYMLLQEFRTGRIPR
jgi:hypothetical protein